MDVTNTVNRRPANDLLDLDMNFVSMSAERIQRFMALAPQQDDIPSDQSWKVDVLTPGGERVRADRQDQPYQTSRNEQACSRDFQSFDVAPATSRPIKAHRRRRRFYNAPCQRSDYLSIRATYFDSGAVHLRREAVSSSCDRNTLREAPKHKSEAIVAMADFDAREERDYDRRGTDSYRGGGNKRRRDGELVASCGFGSQQLTSNRRRWEFLPR